MSKTWFRLLQLLTGYPSPYEDHVDNVAASFYVRGLAQNITMVGFLGELVCISVRTGWSSKLIIQAGCRFYILGQTPVCSSFL
jgi:hypothetical protein